MNNFEMSIVLPTVQWNGHDATGTVFVRLRDGRLSMTGEIREVRHITHAGQCLDALVEMYPCNPLMQSMAEVWKHWHLNDMRAGCEHQRAEKWEDVPVDPSQPSDAYLVIKGYTGWNRMIWKPVEQGGLLNKPCPTCGFKYGSKWLFEKLPQDVLDTIQKWRNDNNFTVKELA